MKFYMRDPAAAQCGMNGLSFEEIGLYTLIIDLIYDQDGVVPDDDAAVAKMIGNRDLRAYRRLKNQLKAKGKIRTTHDGMLDANGVASRILLANFRSTSAKHAADLRWRNHKIAKEIKFPAMPEGNAIYKYKKKERESSTNSDSEIGVAKPAAVAEKVQVEFEVEMEDGSVTKVTRDEYFKILQERDQARRAGSAERRAAKAVPLTVEVDGKDVVRTSDALKELLRARDEFDALAAKVESKPERP